MAGSASATTRPKERCGASHWEGATGPSPAPNAAPTAPPSCSPSSPTHASTTSTQKPGSPPSSLASPIFPPRVCTNCCPGNGSACAKPTCPPISRPPEPLAPHHKPASARALATIPRPCPCEYLRPLPRRWQDLPQQQRGRKSVAGHRIGKAQLDLRRLPTRRRPRRRHAHPHHLRTPQRHRPKSLARRRPRSHRRSSRLASARTAALGMEAPAPSRHARLSAGRLNLSRHIINPPALARLRQSRGLARVSTYQLRTALDQLLGPHGKDIELGTADDETEV